MGHLGSLRPEYRGLVHRLDAGTAPLPEPADPGAWQGWKEIGFTGVTVGYERRGEWRRVQDAFADPELMSPLPLWERKLMAFRAVDDDGLAASCRW